MSLSRFLFILMQCQLLDGFLFLNEQINTTRHVSVQTNTGEIVGKISNSHLNGTLYQVKEFLGIPYAEPPIGENRFRKPIPKAPFMSPFYALDFGSSCLQQQGNNLTKSEDCLFLNIYVPNRISAPLSKVPVMIWIHGGGFQHGSSSLYPGDLLCYFGEVIIVTLNYRLAHLGFLPNSEGLSNFGLWDQHLAIKWVYNNIPAFGGDTKNITIFGESAGSSSVVYQALFVGNKGLFQRAIAESGGITSPWAFDSNQTVNGVLRDFANATGCLGSHDQIMKCVRNKSSDEIASVIEHTNLPALHPNDDNDFVPRHPFEMLIPSPNVNDSIDFFQGLDLMMGSNSIDGAIYLPGFAAALNINNTDNLNIPRRFYEQVIIPEELANVFTNVPSIPVSVKQATILEYTDWSDPDEYMTRNKLVTQFMTDLGMIAPMVAACQLHSQDQKGRTYFYELSVRPDIHLIPVPSWLDGPTQANHGDDLLYLFGTSERAIKSWPVFGNDYKITDQDMRVSQMVMTMWTNFAKSGNPNEPVSVKQYLPVTWPEFDISSQSYLDITPKMTPNAVKKRIQARKMYLWLKFLPLLLK